jgi:hypothetical protein
MHSVPRDEAAFAANLLRTPGETLMVAALLGLLVIVYAIDLRQIWPATNIAAPMALMAILGVSLYRMVTRSTLVIWAPVFWMKLTCLAYFGFGALVPHIANHETVEHIYVLHRFEQEANLKVNIAYALGLLTMNGMAFLLLQMPIGKQAHRARMALEGASSKTLLFALLFLSVGMALRYGFAVPYNLGITDSVLAGSVNTLSKTYYTGIFLLIAYAISSRKAMAGCICVMLVIIEVCVSLASFAKTDLLMILIFSFLGLVSGRASRTALLAGMSVVLVSYFSFQPLVGYGRDVLSTRYGQIRGADVAERWNIVIAYLGGDRSALLSEKQSGLARLSYVNANAYVMERYDAGMPGNTLYAAMAVLVPRALWPDKPIISALGEELNFLVYNRYGSSLGIGYFSEAYWNFGWRGFIPFVAIAGIILSLFSRFSLRVMARGDWLLLPVVLIGVNMGIRTDGYLVPDILGPAWMALLLGLGLLTCGRLASALRPTNAQQFNLQGKGP